MTRIETARVTEMLDLNITKVKAAANKITLEGDLQDLQAEVADLEKAVAELKDSLSGLPFKH